MDSGVKCFDKLDRSNRIIRLSLNSVVDYAYKTEWIGSVELDVRKVMYLRLN